MNPTLAPLALAAALSMMAGASMAAQPVACDSACETSCCETPCEADCDTGCDSGCEAVCDTGACSDQSLAAGAPESLRFGIAILREAQDPAVSADSFLRVDPAARGLDPWWGGARDIPDAPAQ